MKTSRLSFQRKIKIFPVLLSLLLGSALLPSPVFADSSITVATTANTINSADNFCSLPEAITNANDDAQTIDDCVGGSGNDTIQFSDILGTNTITLGATLPNISDTDGLTIDGGGDITIDGNNTYRIFIVDASVPLTLANLTATKGKCGSCLGGVVYTLSGTLTITNSTISNSTQAIYNDSGITAITNSTLSGNSSLFGGAIENSGTLNITNSIFSGNSVSATGGGSAIYNVGVVSIKNSIFANNTGTDHARGAIYNLGTVTISNSTFSANSISGGNPCCNGVGAIYNQYIMTITNSTFSGNSTDTTGGAADIYQLGGSSVLNLYNNILANDAGGGNCSFSGGGTVSGNNNLIESSGTSACGLTNGVNGNIIGSDPALGSLTGSPAYFPLNTGSPAINAGDDTICGATPVSNASQNGITRPQGAHCDIGSFELDNVVPTVDSFTATALGNNLNIPITAFTASDSVGVTGYLITLSSTPPSPSDSGWSGIAPSTYTVVAAGAYLLFPWAKDAAGNVSAVFGSPRDVVVDLTLPTVSSITRASTNPTSATSVNFTVTFSESVSGVDAGDMGFTASGITGASITNVSGSGVTRTVTVNTGTGNGTLRLDFYNNLSVQDLAGNSLSGGDFNGGQSYTISKSPIFADVPFNYWANSFIERLYNAGITGGCTTSPLNYCPDNTVTRAQMAIFLLKGMHGSGFTPPAVGGSTGFGDVATSYWAAAWVKQLAAEGITSGCGGGNYCPDATVSRAQMAVFLLKAKNGSSYSPPAVGVSTGFGDVAIDYWAAAFIKQLVADGITSGCGGGNYCPDADVTRAQMAVFLVKTFNLP